LGAALKLKFGGAGLTRDNSRTILRESAERGFSTIIHCAFNPARPTEAAGSRAIVEENVELTRNLLSLPHDRFVFLSSIEVYPKSDLLHAENERLPAGDAQDPYASAKRACEALVGEQARRPLILRPTAMIGKSMRRNHLYAMIHGEQLSLSPDSEFNYVSHDLVAKFIGTALKLDLSGVYNLATTENILLSEVARELGVTPRFGAYRYRTGSVSNLKAASVLPALAVRSIDVLRARPRFD
jgi:nucleoside-diphosphate-sugar epimerase